MLKNHIKKISILKNNILTKVQHLLKMHHIFDVLSSQVETQKVGFDHKKDLLGRAKTDKRLSHSTGLGRIID